MWHLLIGAAIKLSVQVAASNLFVYIFERLKGKSLYEKVLL